MRVAVLIPAFNAERFIENAVRSALAQTRAPDEVIVVDDGSADRTADLCGRMGPGVRCLRRAHGGKSAARNAGLSATTADFVAFLDADDEFLPTHVEQLLAALESDRADIAYDSVEAPYFSPRRRPPRKPDGRAAYRHLSCYQLWLPASMVRMDFVRASGVLFDPSLEIAEDIDFMARLIACGARVRYVRRYGVRVGRHDANTTRDPIRTRRLTGLALRRLRRAPEILAASDSARFRSELRRGRLHIALMRLAYRVMRDPTARVALRRLARWCGSPRAPVRWQDRVRVAALLGWQAIGRPAWPALTRALFGYNASV